MCDIRLNLRRTNKTNFKKLFDAYFRCGLTQQFHLILFPFSIKRLIYDSVIIQGNEYDSRELDEEEWEVLRKAKDDLKVFEIQLNK